MSKKKTRTEDGAGTVAQENRQTPSDMPDAATLANLAAQSRFERLPPDRAAAQALDLLKQAQAAIASSENERRLSEHNLRRHEEIPPPQQWPASLPDFYKAVVRGKDETGSQPLFKRFLRFLLEREQQQLREDLKSLPANERTDKHTDSVSNMLRLQLLKTEEALAAEVDKRFLDYKARKFDPLDWTAIAGAYLDWWDRERIEIQREKGRKRAAKAYEKKKAAAVAKQTRLRKKKQ